MAARSRRLRADTAALEKKLKEQKEARASRARTRMRAHPRAQRAPRRAAPFAPILTTAPLQPLEFPFFVNSSVGRGPLPSTSRRCASRSRRWSRRLRRRRARRSP
jgi:hypothetical protein